MRKVFWAVLIIAWLIMAALLFVATATKAQDNPHVNTWFVQGCIEAVDETHYNLHFHYTSDGVETFTFSMGDIVGVDIETSPYTGHITTNIPQTFVTSEGYHDEWYISAQSEDSPYTFYLNFQDDVGTAILPLNTWDAPGWCEPGQYSPIPIPQSNPIITPDPIDPCPAWAINGDTGGMICLWYLPTPVVP